MMERKYCTGEQILEALSEVGIGAGDISEVMSCLGRMPSAEPDVPDTNVGDMISRQDAIDAVNELTRWYYETFHEKRPTAIAVIDKLMDLPSAEPEIIRCKDCKHMIINEKHEAKPMICCFTKMCGTTEPDWFCADGERRDDE